MISVLSTCIYYRRHRNVRKTAYIRTSQHIHYFRLKLAAMTAGRVCILLSAIFGISWVAGYSPPQQAYHDMPGYNQQPNDKHRVDFDRPIEYVPDDFFQNVDQSIVFHKDSTISSSVPLEEVESPDGHRKLAGTVKIPGGVSSVTIEKSPQGQKTSQVIKYGHIEHDGPVVISTNQDISDIPEEVPSQQGIKVPTKKLPANDPNTEHVKPNNGQPENHGVNYDKDSKIDQSIVFHKDSTISSSVPLKEVDSSDGHRKLVGTSKIPGGVSSVVIEESPTSRHVSQLIKYRGIERNGPVIINSNQDMRSVPLKASRNGSPDNSPYPIVAMTIIPTIMEMYSKLMS